MKSIIKYLPIAAICLTACEKNELNVVDIPFSVEKTTVNVGETVNFSIGSGADASSIYFGDQGTDFQKSRIALVEMKGYDENYLRNNLVAERIPGLKEYYYRIPNSSTVSPDLSFEGGEIKLYEGKLVSWDVSNSTLSKYIQITPKGDGTPQTLTIKPGKAVVPQMLNLNNNTLRNLGALRNVANNNFEPALSFPDGFTQASQTGQSVRFSLQLVIDGVETRTDYFTFTVREILTRFNINMGPMISNFLTTNPTADASKGIDEIRFTINADDPTKTDDDGDLLDYKGNVFMQEVRVGSADNMIKAFDKGSALPYVYSGTEYVQSYKYSKPGTYTATLVSIFVGRKQYSGDGYKTGRADEISADEYPTERQIKTIEITVN